MDLFAGKHKNRYRVIDGKSTIELKLKSPNQLFDERDPAPFRERDLDDDAARYIVSSLNELPSDREAKLSLYFAGSGEFEHNSDVIRKAIHAYFDYESELKRRELRSTFKQGFISLGIGISFLLICTWFSRTMHLADETDLFKSLLQEWLFIMGWVAMWKPINIFLYEWWPIRSAQKTLQRLSRIEIKIHPLEKAASPLPETEPRREPATLQIPSLKTS